MDGRDECSWAATEGERVRVMEALTEWLMLEESGVVKLECNANEGLKGRVELQCFNTIPPTRRFLAQYGICETTLVSSVSVLLNACVSNPHSPNIPLIYIQKQAKSSIHVLVIRCGIYLLRLNI
jgi:hypothetical protein